MAAGSGAAPVQGPAGSLAALPGPKIVFDAMVYDFGKVMAGEPVKHTFYFTNTGSEDLVLSSVQAACGCTVVENWARQVKPGGWGLIPVTLNTTAYNTAVTKQVTVVCNDPGAPRGTLQLQLKGVVWKPIEVLPPIVSLMLKPDVSSAVVMVRITNHLGEPLVLSAPVSTDPNIGAALSTNTFGREYMLAISNTAALASGANLQAHVTLQTSIAKNPLVDVTVYANQQAPLMVYPPRIDLKPAPLATNQFAYVTIINNSTNPISLSEPKVDVWPVDVTVTQTRTGRYFTVVLKFPPGFALPGGRPGAFTVKTTSPQKPLVTVPIYQPAHGSSAAARRPSQPAPGPGQAVGRPPQPLAQPAPRLVAASSGPTNGIRLLRPPPPIPATAVPATGGGPAPSPGPVPAAKGSGSPTAVAPTPATPVSQ